MNTTAELVLHDYWRSIACFRVPPTPTLLPHASLFRPVNDVNTRGAYRRAEHHALNPQESVPVLMVGRRTVRQSMAIIEYLEESHPKPQLLPPGLRERAHVRSLAQLIACDVHPLNNLRVMQYLENELGVAAPARETWMRHWMALGLRAFEEILAADDARGVFCHGDTPGLADACLIPQVYNAQRFNLDLTPYPNIRAINERCLALPAFDAARPEKQPGASA